MSNDAIEIKDREGNIKLRVTPNPPTGKLPTWNDNFLDLRQKAGTHLPNYDFSSAIRE